MMHATMHGGWYGMGWLYQLLIFLAFFLVVWWLLRQNTTPAGTPEEILRRRLAAGEITVKEYRELRKEIE